MVRPLPPVEPVPCDFKGSTIVCVGTGPSLTQADLDLCLAACIPSVAVNDAYTLMPWADILFAADSHWWRSHQGVPGFQGRKYSIMPWENQRDVQQEFADVHILRNTGETGLELDPTGLRTGINSGYMAINLAVHLGATTIILLGYDMGGRHFFGDHPKELNQVSDYPRFLRNYQTLVEPLAAAGVRVINATRTTALTVFPQMSLAKALGFNGPRGCPEGPLGIEGPPGLGPPCC